VDDAKGKEDSPQEVHDKLEAWSNLSEWECQNSVIIVSRITMIRVWPELGFEVVNADVRVRRLDD
jgi:hypothetical protein